MGYETAIGYGGQPTGRMELANRTSIHIETFETRYKRKLIKNAQGDLEPRQVPYDVMVYGPAGDERNGGLEVNIEDIQRVLPLEECGDNLSALQAHGFWLYVEPIYQHWKQTNAMPVNGTALAAWPGVSKQEAEIYKKSHLLTVESIAEAGDIQLDRTGLPDQTWHQHRSMAKAFLASGDIDKRSVEIEALRAANEEKDARMAEMADQLREMQAMMAEVLATKQAETKAKSAKAA